MVQPGVIRDDLNHYLRPDGLFFGPETSTANRAMIGGMVGNNSCGLHSIVWGSVRENLLAVNALLSDGSEVTFKNESIQKKYIPKIITLFNDKGTSNSVLDKYFYSDMLSVFQKEKDFNNRSPYLQRYYFYCGIINLCSNKTMQAFKQIPLSWIIGRRKLFYFLFTFKFLLRILVRDKIKIK
jgi:hypothetical protein